MVTTCILHYWLQAQRLRLARTYQIYFNLVRPTRTKTIRTPGPIIERLTPRSPLELCLLPPVFLDYYLNDSGRYDVPRQPQRRLGLEEPESQRT